ncbi:TrbC/VirB2 family protein [Mollicutes bacterium LVI A0078]|nr:TrbC/VirB2 family protein [Mollicutes bacterium LVI A0078]
MNNLEMIKINAETVKNAITNMSPTVMATTNDFDSVISNATDQIVKHGEQIAVLSIVVVALVLIFGTKQMKEMAKENMLWIIIGILIISSADNIVNMFYM